MNKTFEQYMEAISQKQWDNDDEGIKTKFYKTFDKEIYKEVEPLLEKLFTKLNGGIKPEDKTVFIKPISNGPLWKDAVKNTNRSAINKFFFEKLIESKLCSFLPDGSFSSTTKAYNNYLKNIYYKDGKKTNLSDFLISRFDGKFITKCIYKKVIQILTPQEGFTENIKNNMILAIEEKFEPVFQKTDDGKLKSWLIPTFIKDIKSSSFIVTDDILKQIEPKVAGIPDKYVDFITSLLFSLNTTIVWDRENGEFKQNFIHNLYPCSGSKYVIGFSYDHRWVASQSTHQGWRSCMKLNEETAYNHLVGKGASNGCFIAYLFDKTAVGKEGHGATGRVLLKPYATKTADKRNISEDSIIWVADKEYGELPVWFTPIVTKIVDKAQDRKNKNGIFHFPKNLTYNDGLPWSISSEPYEKIIKSISNGTKQFGELVPEYQFKLIANYPKVLKLSEVRSLLFNNYDFHKGIIEYIKIHDSANEIDRYVNNVKSFVKSLTPGQQVEFFKNIVKFENENDNYNYWFLVYRLKNMQLNKNVVFEIISKLKGNETRAAESLCLGLIDALNHNSNLDENIFNINEKIYFEFIFLKGYDSIVSSSILQKILDNFSKYEEIYKNTKYDYDFHRLIANALYNFKKIKVDIYIIEKLINFSKHFNLICKLFECAATSKVNVEKFSKILKKANISTEDLVKIRINIIKIFNNPKSLSYFSSIFNEALEEQKNNPELMSEYDFMNLLKRSDKENMAYIEFVILKRLKNFKIKQQISYLYELSLLKLDYENNKKYFCKVLEEKENEIFENICFYNIFFKPNTIIINNFLIYSKTLENFAKKLYNKYKEFFPWWQLYETVKIDLTKIAQGEFWAGFYTNYCTNYIINSKKTVSNNELKKIYESKGKLDWVIALCNMRQYAKFDTTNMMYSLIGSYVNYSKHFIEQKDLDNLDKYIKRFPEQTIDHTVLPANYRNEAQTFYKEWKNKVLNNVLQEAEDRGIK